MYSLKRFVSIGGRRFGHLLQYNALACNHNHGLWSDPVTQPSILEFLDEINYFEEPKKVINVGVRRESDSLTKSAAEFTEPVPDNTAPSIQQKDQDIEQVLELLDTKIEMPQLDFDAINAQWYASTDGRDQLALLASHFSIYRDLLMDTNPRSGAISFTRAQADRLKRFIPFYWITDQPHGRVPLTPLPETTLTYFEPLVPVIAKFISSDVTSEQLSDQDNLVASVVYHGNVIAARDAATVPSITLDGRNFSGERKATLDGSEIFNMSSQSGDISLTNFPENYDKFLTVALVNLDSIRPHESSLHWMVTNVRKIDGTVQSQESCKFLPTFGIRGLGHSRYVFVVMEHSDRLDHESNKITDFSIGKRFFKLSKFLNDNKHIGMRPIGLSWYQTVWDLSSNSIFHDYLKMRAPEYEYIQPVPDVREEKPYPGRVPFNLYLDRHADPKDINKRVLLERLKNLDLAQSYKDQYEKPKVSPNIHAINGPTWMVNVVKKQRYKVGYWRGLRPASALIPLNNNADLDNPKFPTMPHSLAPLNAPNPYPGRPKIKCLRDLPYSKPITEHPSHYVLHESHLSDEDRKKIK